MCALLSGLYIGGDHEGGGDGEVGPALAKEGKKCVFKVMSIPSVTLLTHFLGRLNLLTFKHTLTVICECFVSNEMFYLFIYLFIYLFSSRLASKFR